MENAVKNTLNNLLKNIMKFNRVGILALAVGVLVLGGISVAVTKTLYSKRMVAHNAQIVRAGRVGAWAYRCIYSPDTLAAGPSLCGMEQMIYANVPDRKDPVPFGSVFISHATQDPKKLALQNVPWFLSLIVKSNVVDNKTPAQLIVSRSESIPVNWKNCGKGGCAAEVVLSEKQLADVLALKKTEVHVLHQGATTPWVINFNFAGAHIAMDNLVQWSKEAPFK